MIASRRPRGRKYSAARMIACSKSGCSNSLTASALLRLPIPRMLQHGQIPEIKPGQWIQTLPQYRKPAFRLAELLADGTEYGADTRRFRRGDLEQSIESPRFTNVIQQLVHGFLR